MNVCLSAKDQCVIVFVVSHDFNYFCLVCFSTNVASRQNNVVFCFSSLIEASCSISFPRFPSLLRNSAGDISPVPRGRLCSLFVPPRRAAREAEGPDVSGYWHLFILHSSVSFNQTWNESVFVCLMTVWNPPHRVSQRELILQIWNYPLLPLVLLKDWKKTLSTYFCCLSIILMVFSSLPCVFALGKSDSKEESQTASQMQSFVSAQQMRKGEE